MLLLLTAALSSRGWQRGAVVVPQRSPLLARARAAATAEVSVAAPATAVETALALHEEEVSAGRAAFALEPADSEPLVPWRFDDASFAPPFGALDESACPQRVFATSAPLLAAAECDALIAEASAAMAEGLRSTFTYTAASRLGEVHTRELPRACAWLARALRERFWPLLASRFGVEPARLAVYDSLLVRYSAADGGVRQPVHRDAALFTVNVPLSAPDSFEGGGTWFEAGRRVAKLARGHALAHASDERHAGHRLRSGERWVLVLFALHEGRPELPRRLGELAAAARREARLQAAADIYTEALAMEPADLELLYGQAAVRAALGDARGAARSFAAAAEAYAHCPRPHAALGTLALETGETEAALARFDRARALAADEEEGAWWEGAVNGALCAALLAEASGAEATAGWRERLRDDARRLRRALANTPGGDERLTELLARVEGLAAERAPR